MDTVYYGKGKLPLRKIFSETFVRTVLGLGKDD